MKKMKNKGPKILVLDIETTEMLVYSWGIGDQYISHEDIAEDWSVLSWTAKWLHSKKIMYMDVQNEKNKRNDKKILIPLWKLLDEADIVITQNGRAFDEKKIASRMIFHGMPPYSKFVHDDVLVINRKHFKHTSNKLAYISQYLKADRQKLTHKKFPGKTLWRECMKGNPEAFKEMKLYNNYDVLATEDVYKKVKPWDNKVNHSVFHEGNICSCGSSSFLKRGFRYTNSGKFQRYRCNKCGKEMSDSINLLKNTKTMLR
jgi:RNase_H superfamily